MIGFDFWFVGVYHDLPSRVDMNSLYRGRF